MCNKLRSTEKPDSPSNKNKKKNTEEIKRNKYIKFDSIFNNSI